MSKSEQIRSLYTQHEGLTVADIAEQVGVRYQFAYNVISRHCAKHGEEVRKANPVTASSQIRQMVDDGLTPGQIAKALNTNYAFVHQVVKKYKLEKGITNEPTTQDQNKETEGQAG